MSRVSRRKFLSRAALALGATPILLATACQSAAPPPQPTATTAAPSDGATPATGASPEAQSTQAPSIAGSSLNILWGTFFDARWQDEMKALVDDFASQSGVKCQIDFLGWADLQPKIGAALQAGGLDIAELWPGWHHIYKASLVDVTEIAEEVAEAGGGWTEYVQNSGPEPDGKYFGVPHGESNASMAYRISYFQEALDALGMDKFDPNDGTTMDMTWEEYFAVAKWLKENKGKPFGQALGHSTGDPPGFTYPYMWSYGSKERTKDGKVAFNVPEFVEGMKLFIEGYKGGYDETGLSWDDSANNRAYHADQISSTYNGSSIYFTALKEFPDIAADTQHMLIPKGPHGRFYRLSTRTTAILAKSKNIEAAKEFIRWFHKDENYGRYYHVQEGYQLPTTKKWVDDPMWDKDPKMKPFKDQANYGRDQGWEGPNDEKAGEVYAKYIIIDTFSRAVSSGDAEGAIAWGEDQLKRIYEA